MQGLRWSKITENSHDNIIIVCTGPSLKDFDFNLLRDKGYIIAVNDAGNYVPFADAWFTLDPWGLTGKQLPSKEFTGQLISAVPEDYGLIDARSAPHRVRINPNVSYLHRIPFHTYYDVKTNDYLTWGLNEDTGSINTGNSGYGALNLAYHMRPKRIYLFGCDATRGYFFDEAKATRSLNHLPLIFRSTLPQLEKAGIEVINASPLSKIDCFKKYTLNTAIKKLNAKDTKEK